MPGSFTSHLSMHVNRIGVRAAGATLAACLALGSESAPRDRAVRTTWIFASNNRGPFTEVRKSLI